MKDKPVQILDDPRPIKQICQRDDWWAVGRQDVTKIVVYGEPSMYCNLPWFAVYVGNEIISRVNGAFVSDVWYGKTRDEKNKISL